ncbi:MAG: hypothetical protein ACM3MG_07760 [Bacillota bacterium]
MKVLGIFFGALISSISFAALPPQFSDCLSADSAQMSIYDLKAIAAVAKVNYCQNQSGLTNKAETLALLKSDNVNLGISVSRTTYSREDLMDLAKANSYVLYVDSNRIGKDYLMELAKAGVQIVVMSATAYLSKADLLELAKAHAFIYNVNSPVIKEDVKDLVNAGVTVVLRSGQYGLSKEDVVEVAKLNPSLVSIAP